MKLQELTKIYPDGTHAVRGIDLDVPDGSFVVLLGPSGCGKTTTLRMVAGLEVVTSGRVILGETDVTHLEASERDVGFVFQFYALYPHMTVRDNIGFPLENRGVSRQPRETSVREIAGRLGIADLLDRFPGQLSGGDQQRVSLARAIVRSPAIYLMDEPLGQLDPSIRLDIREIIKRQQLETGTSTLYVTHDQEEALSLADIVVVMNEGQIEQAGPVDEIYEKPASVFVADFVGSPGMNLIEGEVYSREDRVLFTANGSDVPLPDIEFRGPAMLGIRPENIEPSADGLPATVEVCEYFGDHHIHHLSTPIGPITTRSGTAERSGQKTSIALDPAHVHFFDAQSGRRVT